MAQEWLQDIGGYDIEDLQPDEIHGSNTSDVNFLNGDNNFYAYRLRPKTEQLRIIDKYFYRYGYKVNTIKIPNTSHRQNFNYIQIGKNEICCWGNIPEKDLQNINNAFRKGATLWNNHTNMLNFNVSNGIN